MWRKGISNPMKRATKKAELITENRHVDFSFSREPGARLESYRRVLEATLGLCESGALTIRIPVLRGLRRRLPRTSFHATPEVFFQQDGETEFTMPEQSFRLRAGEVCVMPRGMPHGERTRDGRGPFATMVGMFRGGAYSFHLARATPRRTVLSHTTDWFETPAHLSMLGYLDDLVEAAAEGGRPAKPLIRGLFTAYLAQALRHLKQGANEKPGDESTLVARCRRLIEVEFSRVETNVRWLALQLECSPDHLSRAFRRETGTRLTVYLQDRRLRHAKELLEHSDLNIAETAWASGFRQPAYFDQLFRARNWTTPKRYRLDCARRGR